MKALFNIGMFFLSPFIGLAYLMALPFVVASYFTWYFLNKLYGDTKTSVQEAQVELTTKGLIPQKN